METLYAPLLRRAHKAYQRQQHVSLRALPDASVEGEWARPGVQKQVRMLMHALSSRRSRVADSAGSETVWMVGNVSEDTTDDLEFDSPIIL
ncbi:hypothetical protein K523DRAFT_237339 [Schizophyllum commune Tattone D]|nr:hypothetical protein K523DRAFT_237339 [Schizophyllum commune Tattone D]